MRGFCAATVAAIVAGLLAGGIGGRLVMRILALTSPERRGALTANENVIGEFTLEGTIGLIVFTTLFSVPFGWLYVVIRRWLPGAGATRALLYGLALTAMMGWTLIDNNNRDFFILRPRALAVGLFLALPLLYGLIVASVHGPLERFYERRTLRFPDVVAFVPVLILTIGFIALPFVAAAFLAGLQRERSDRLRRALGSARSFAVGRTLIAVASAAGLAALVTRSGKIL